MNNWRDTTITQIMGVFQWSRPFSSEYLMERYYNGHTHNQAFENAMKSSWIDQEDKPSN